MTPEQAYKLANVVGFYNSPIWQKDKEKPWYYDFYVWNKGWNDGCEMGKLKYELFDTTELKAAYVKGLIDKQGTLDKNYIMIANALDQVDKYAEFVSHVCYENHISDSVREVRRQYGYPICSTIIISDEAMQFFRDLKCRKNGI